MKGSKFWGLVVLVSLSSFILQGIIPQQSVQATGTISLIAHTQSTGGASPAINTVGATLLVIQEVRYSNVTQTPTDSKGNSWTPLTEYSGNSESMRYFYVCGPATDSAQTFTPGVGGLIFVAAFSGTAASNCLDTGTDAGRGPVSSPGVLPAITPSAAGDLIISGMQDSARANTVRSADSGLSIIETNTTTYALSGALSWGQYNSANPLAVTWKQTPSWTYFDLAIAAFKPAVSSGGSAPSISSFTASPSNVTAGQSAVLSWGVSGATSLSIDNGVGAVSGSSVSVSPATTTTYTLTVTNSGGSATSTATVNVSAPDDNVSPSVPQNLTATSVSQSQINLSWSASTDNVGVAGYRVYRNGSQIGTASTNNYGDNGLAPITSYSYTVAAYDAAGNISALSAPAAATTFAASSGYPVGWTDLTNTHLHSVCPPNNGVGGAGSTYSNYAFNSFCDNVINAWSSAAADTVNNKLIIWGGGHSDYYGNEVYSLNLNANPVTLTRLTNPSQYDFSTSTYAEVNPDGTPVSRHSYDGLVYLPNQNAMFDFGGNTAPNGSGSNHTWTFTPSDNTWHVKDPVNGYNIVGLPTSPYGTDCAYDSSSDSVFCANGLYAGFYKYTPSTNIYTKLVTSGFMNYAPATTAAIDPVHKLMVFMGLGNSGFAVQAIDISGTDPGYQVQDWTSQSSGCAAMGVSWPGFAYDSAIGKFVGWPNSGNTVYIFDPSTKTCTSQTFSGGPSGTTPNGTLGRFSYFPALDAFALVNNAEGDAYIFKLSSTTPDTTPPVVTLSAANSSNQALTAGATADGNLILTATASDPIISGQLSSGLQSLTIALDGNVVASTSTAGSLTYSLSTQTLLNTSHVLVATARDNAGNITFSQTFQLNEIGFGVGWR